MSMTLNLFGQVNSNHILYTMLSVLHSTNLDSGLHWEDFA